MLKIGDFARLAQVTTQTLRHYDETGLLKPDRVDSFTSYRYYSLDQLPKLHRILALKELGFSLVRISKLVSEDLPASEVRGMLRMQLEDIRSKEEDLRDRSRQLEFRLQQIETDSNPPRYDVLIKSAAPQLAVTVRGIIPAYPAIAALWEELGAQTHLRHAPRAGPHLSLCHATEPDIDCEVCMPVAQPVPVAGRAIVRELPGVDQAACVIHRGPYDTLIQAYTALWKWMEQNGYLPAGPDREVYLQPPDTEHGPADDLITEVQLPVRREDPGKPADGGPQ